MTPWVLRRVAVAAVSLVLASMAVFAVLNVLPGSPAQVILGTRSSPAAVHQLSVQLGLDRPLWRQYGSWAGGLLQGSFGRSYISRLPIGGQIGAALAVTGPLIGLAMVVGVLVAAPLGVGGALRQGKASGALIGAISQVGIAVPTVVGAILLVGLLSVKASLFPSGGFPGWSRPLAALHALVLPAVSLGLVEGAILSRYVRAAVTDQLRSDYLRTAMAKGLRRGAALRRHGLRNAMIPLVTVVGLELAGLIVGAIVVENVFNLPGIGYLLLNAVTNRDLLTVQDVVMLVAVAVLAINLAVDVSYRFVDPRIGGRG